MRVIELSSRLQLSFVGNVLPDALTTGDINDDGCYEFLIGNSDGDMAIFKGRGGEGSWLGFETQMDFDESYWSEVEAGVFNTRTGFSYNRDVEKTGREKRKAVKMSWENAMNLEKSARKPWAIAKQLGTISSIVVGDVLNNGKQIIVVINCEGKMYLFEYPFGISELESSWLDSNQSNSTNHSENNVKSNNSLHKVYLNSTDKPHCRKCLIKGIRFSNHSQNSTKRIYKKPFIEGIDSLSGVHKMNKLKNAHLNRNNGSQISEQLNNSFETQINKRPKPTKHIKRSKNGPSVFKKSSLYIPRRISGASLYCYHHSQKPLKRPSRPLQKRFGSGIPNKPKEALENSFDSKLGNNDTYSKKNIERLSSWQPYKISSPTMAFDIPTNAERAIIADINDDGLNEIIISTSDGFIYSFGITLNAVRDNKLKAESAAQDLNISLNLELPKQQFEHLNSRLKKLKEIKAGKSFESGFFLDPTKKKMNFTKPLDNYVSIENKQHDFHDSCIAGDINKSDLSENQGTKGSNLNSLGVIQADSLTKRAALHKNASKMHSRKAFSVSSMIEITGKSGYSSRASPTANKLVVYNEKFEKPQTTFPESINILSTNNTSYSSSSGLLSTKHINDRYDDTTKNQTLDSLNSLIIDETKNPQARSNTSFIQNPSIGFKTSALDKPQVHGLFNLINSSVFMKTSSTAPASLANSKSNSTTHSRNSSLPGKTDVINYHKTAQSDKPNPKNSSKVYNSSDLINKPSKNSLTSSVMENAGQRAMIKKPVPNTNYGHINTPLSLSFEKYSCGSRTDDVDNSTSFDQGCTIFSSISEDKNQLLHKSIKGEKAERLARFQTLTETDGLYKQISLGAYISKKLGAQNLKLEPGLSLGNRGAECQEPYDKDSILQKSNQPSFIVSNNNSPKDESRNGFNTDRYLSLRNTVSSNLGNARVYENNKETAKKEPYFYKLISPKPPPTKAKKQKRSVSIKKLNTWFMDNFIGSLTVVKAKPDIFQAKFLKGQGSIEYPTSLREKSTDISGANINYESNKNHFLIISKPGGKLTPINPEGAILETIEYSKNSTIHGTGYIKSSRNRTKTSGGQSDAKKHPGICKNGEKDILEIEKLLEHKDGYYKENFNSNTTSLNSYTKNANERTYPEQGNSYGFSHHTERDLNSLDYGSSNYSNTNSNLETDNLYYSFGNSFIDRQPVSGTTTYAPYPITHKRLSESSETNALRQSYSQSLYRNSNRGIESTSLPKDRFFPKLKPAETTLFLESVEVTTQARRNLYNATFSSISDNNSVYSSGTNLPDHDQPNIGLFSRDLLIPKRIGKNAYGVSPTQLCSEPTKATQSQSRYNGTNAFLEPKSSNQVNTRNNQVNTGNIVSSLKAVLKAGNGLEGKQNNRATSLGTHDNKIAENNTDSYIYENSLIKETSTEDSFSNKCISRNFQIPKKDEAPSSKNFEIINRFSDSLSNRINRKESVLSTSAPLSFLKPSISGGPFPSRDSAIKSFIDTQPEPKNENLVSLFRNRSLNYYQSQNENKRMTYLEAGSFKGNFKGKSVPVKFLEKAKVGIQTTESTYEHSITPKTKNLRKDKESSLYTIKDTCDDSNDDKPLNLNDFIDDVDDVDVSAFTVGNASGGADILSLGLLPSLFNPNDSEFTNASKIKLTEYLHQSTRHGINQNPVLINGSSWIFSLTIDGMLFGYNYEDKNSLLVDINARDPLLGIWKVSIPLIHKNSASTDILNSNSVSGEKLAQQKNDNQTYNSDEKAHGVSSSEEKSSLSADYLVACTWRGTTYFVDISLLLTLVSEYSFSESQRRVLYLTKNTPNKTDLHRLTSHPISNQVQANTLGLESSFGFKDFKPINDGNNITNLHTKITNSPVIQFKFLEVVNAFLAAPYAPVIGGPNISCLFYVDFKTRVWVYYHLESVSELDYNYGTKINQNSVPFASHFLQSLDTETNEKIELKDKSHDVNDTKHVNRSWNVVHELLKRNSRIPWIPCQKLLKQNLNFSKGFLSSQGSSLNADNFTSLKDENSPQGNSTKKSDIGGLLFKQNAVISSEDLNIPEAMFSDISCCTSEVSIKKSEKLPGIDYNETLKYFSTIISTKLGIILKTEAIAEFNRGQGNLDSQQVENIGIGEYFENKNRAMLYDFGASYYTKAKARSFFNFDVVEIYIKKLPGSSESYIHKETTYLKPKACSNTLEPSPVLTQGRKGKNDILSQPKQPQVYADKKARFTESQINDAYTNGCIAEFKIRSNSDVGLVNFLEFLSPDLLNKDIKPIWCDILKVKKGTVTENVDMATVFGLSELINKTLYEYT